MYNNADGQWSNGMIAAVVIATVIFATLVAGVAVYVHDDSPEVQDTGGVPIDLSTSGSGMLLGATGPGVNVEQTNRQPGEHFGLTSAQGAGMMDGAILVVASTNPSSAGSVSQGRIETSAFNPGLIIDWGVEYPLLGLSYPIAHEVFVSDI